ncbi:ABC transporter ATP-binding protein [Kitasatospora sp. NPDC050543]|uniref:ABC transporter ATP-binding protein n=1 Tax=Kitasatospora sp. NPDC050543 TaxID=3364054 RepID=UPI0037A637CE
MRVPADRESVIRASGLTKVYPRAQSPAVDRLDLDVRHGEIFGLLGPNGAGKTTTVGMLTTRVIPTAGSARIGDIDVIARPALAKQVIAVVSQQNTLDRALTVRENLYYHGLLFGMPPRRARQVADGLLERFHLSRWANSSVYELSGGMAQRLMVARAIGHRPAVLFLDEPTGGLDPQGRLALWDVMAGLIADGQTILLTTHNMEEADRLCDRVAIVDHGRVLALDTPAALKQSVQADSVVTVQGRGDTAALAQRLTHDLGTVARSRPIPGGLELQVRSTERLLPRVVSTAEAAGFEVVDLSVAGTTLETVFIGLTGKELRD